MLAVLEKRAGLKISDQDVYLNVAGGLKISDTAADLAVLCALASSYRELPVPAKSFMIGEIGLGGEVRMVPRMDQRIREGLKMGFKKAFVPDNFGKGRNGTENNETDIEKFRYISQAITTVLDR